MAGNNNSSNNNRKATAKHKPFPRHTDTKEIPNNNNNNFMRRVE